MRRGKENLLEELGRVEAEPSNRNRRAEISRVHGELNRGYKHGKQVKKNGPVRPIDIPWPKKYIDERLKPVVDCQYVNRKKALRGTGIKIKKDKPYTKPKINCYQCGRFISEYTAYADYCPNCGANNAP